MRLALIVMFVTIWTSMSAQNVQSVRFVFVGEQLKPHGTLLISKGKLIRPDDQLFDEHFGRSIKTNGKTFDILVDLIKAARYVSPVLNSGANANFFRIIMPDNSELYVVERDFRSFFSLLVDKLRDKNFDQKVAREIESISF